MADLQSDPEEISSYELTVLACLLEGGATKLVHTEDLAIRALIWHHIDSAGANTRRIDLDIVRVSLSNATKDKNGALVQGSKDSGWSLTRRGMQWLRRLGRSFPNSSKARQFLGRIAGVPTFKPRIAKLSV